VAGDLAEHFAKVHFKFISGGQMQLRLWIWQRLFISGRQKQLRLGIWQRFIPSLLVGIWQSFIPSLLVGDRCSCGWGFDRGLFQVYWWAFGKVLFQDY